MDITITNAQINEQLNLQVSKKYKPSLPSFGMLGNTERRTKVTSMNMHEILKNLSKNSTYFFWLFVEERNPNTNHVQFIPADNAEAKRLTKAYKELHKLEVLKRVKRGEYLINPKAYLPHTEQFENVWTEWSNL